MTTELTQIPFETDADILHIHEVAMQTARRAGISVAEQIRFAAAVAENCFDCEGADHIIFSIEEKENGRWLLKAEMRVRCRSIEREFFVRPGRRALLPAVETTVQKQKRWEDSYRDMQQFTFALAHDLKNSLTKLKLALSLLEDEEIPPSISNYVQIIHRASGRLEAIMMSLNKIIEVGDSSPDVVKKVSPELVFADVHEEFAEALAKSGAVVTVDFSNVNELSYIEVYLKSIFANLVSNAIKYSSPQRPLEIAVTASKQGFQTVLSFSDNGQGIDLQRFGDKLFMPFTRFSSNTDGSGIGLYLIKNIVERNGGKIEIESRPDHGTTFHLFLQEYFLPADHMQGKPVKD